MLGNIRLYSLVFWILMLCIGVVSADQGSQYKKKAEVRSRGINVLYKEQNLERKIKAMIGTNKHIKYTSELFVMVCRADVVVIGGVEHTKDIDFIASILKDAAPGLKQKMYVQVIHNKYNTLSRSKDRWLRIRARVELLKTVGWKAGQMRVVVYNQTAYIMGSSHENMYDIETILRPWAKKVVIV